MKNRLADYEMPDQTGRTWLITGATNGIGKEVARVVAAAGARLIVTARHEGRGQALADELGDRVRVLPLDLGDLASVRAAAAQLDEDVDVLVNNAGRVAARREETKDGFETVMGTNAFGPFAFTNLVADRVRDRVVITGSNAHEMTHLHLDDLHFRNRRYQPMAVYAQSKLADMVWGLELARRLRPRGVDVVLAHPGWCLTNLQNVTGIDPIDRAITTLSYPFAQSAADGAHNILAAATRDVPSGSYLGPDGFRQLRGKPTMLGRTAEAADPVLAEKLWQIMADATGTDLPLG